MLGGMHRPEILRSRIRPPSEDDAGYPLHPPGGYVGFVGVTHGVQLPGEELFFAEVHLHGGPAPVRHYLPTLIDLIWNMGASWSNFPEPRLGEVRGIGLLIHARRSPTPNAASKTLSSFG